MTNPPTSYATSWDMTDPVSMHHLQQTAKFLPARKEI